MNKKSCKGCGTDISHRDSRTQWCSKKCYDAPRFRGTRCLYCEADLIVARQSVNKTKFCSYRCKYLYKNPKINEDYFSHPNLENSYWAGLIAADGCIHVPKSGQARLSIGLKIEDEAQILRLQTALGAGATRTSVEHKASAKKAYTAKHYCLCSDKICLDLIKNFNITQRKSLTLTPPNLTGDLAYAFIAGYIDGDGSYYMDKTSKRPVLGIRGTREMLSWITEQYGIDRVPKINSGIHRISFSGDDAILIRESYRRLNLPVLPRKEHRWETLGANLNLLKTDRIDFESNNENFSRTPEFRKDNVGGE